jgi:hypothetical protein
LVLTLVELFIAIITMPLWLTFIVLAYPVSFVLGFFWYKRFLNRTEMYLAYRVIGLTKPGLKPPFWTWRGANAMGSLITWVIFFRYRDIINDTEDEDSSDDSIPKPTVPQTEDTE